MKSLVVITLTVTHDQPSNPDIQTLTRLRDFFLHQRLPLRDLQLRHNPATVILARASGPYPLQEG